MESETKPNRAHHGNGQKEPLDPTKIAPSHYGRPHSRIENYEMKVSIPSKLTCRYGAQGMSGQVQSIVPPQLRFWAAVVVITIFALLCATPPTVPGKKSVLQRTDKKIYHVLPESLRIAGARPKFDAFLKKARGNGMVDHGCIVIGRVVTATAVVEKDTLIVDVRNGGQQSLDGIGNLGQGQISTIERVGSAGE